MILFALGFVFGACLLQQQANLPSLQSAWILAPGLIIFLNYHRFKINFYIREVCFLAFAGLLGFFWAAIFANLRLADELPREWEQQKIQIVGVVSSLPEVTERGERFRFDVEKILTPGAKVPKHISLNFYRQVESQKTENAPSLSNYFHAGERWQFTVRLKRPHSTYNPHGFDFEAWALAENIRATGTIRSKSGYKKLSDFVWRHGLVLKPGYLLENVREKIGNRISQTLVGKPYAGVIRALVMGDDSQISRDVWEVYLRTGTIHLVSISGLHITMLAGLAFACVAFAWRRIPSFVLHMPTRQAATIGAAFVAILYACLAGLSIPTQRTLLMLLTLAAALLLGRRIPTSRVLAIALFAVVLADPWSVISPGFWLSFSAIALIAYVSANRLGLMNWLKEATNTQWAVTIGLTPLLIFMFGQTSLISPIANALAIPVISLVVVPLAILGGLLQLDSVLHLAHFVLALCMHGLNWLASSPIATWNQAAAPFWTIILAIFGVSWLLLPRGFPLRILGIILLLPMLFINPINPAQSEMKVTVLDVGQGLAVVIQTAQHAMLYDAGPGYSPQSDAGSKIVVPFLRAQGIKKLDGLLISHNDLDHSGGANSVMLQLPVSWLMSSYTLPENRVKVKKISCTAGQAWVWDGVRFEVLYPSAGSDEQTEIKDNNKSCVLKVTSKYGAILLTGDIEKEAEIALLGANKHVLRSDVLIAPHHGSKTSSTVGFVQAVAAKHTIFTMGYLNRFGHPKSLIEKRYEESGASLYRTDYQGALELSFTHAAPLRIDSWREKHPKYWQDKYSLKN